MKRLIGLLIILLLISTIRAIPVPESKVISVAGKWMDLQTSMRKDTSSIESVHKVYNKSMLALYIINYKNDGFVITTSDDRCQPILAWSDEGSLTLDSDNPGIKYWLNTYSEEVYQVIEKDLPSTETRALWQSIDTNTFSRTDSSVAPLLPSRWHQTWPYNALCPEDPDGSGGHVAAGCVATAMAQCMRYWNYPEVGEGTHSFYSTGYGYLSVNYSASEYDWWQMPREIGSDYEQIAKLIYDCGVSVEMMYSADASGAFSRDVPDAMKDYFGYANSTTFVEKSYYSPTQWGNMLRSELDEARVIYYSGSGDDGGHAFVMDGYRENDYFHIDFGWSGSGNGYYLVSNINPGYVFNDNQAAVIGIVPENYTPNEGLLIWNGMNSADCSGNDFYVEANAQGFVAENTYELPYNLNGYDAVFLSFGNSQDGYSELTDPMALAVKDYLQKGGNLYIEGADVLGVDQNSNTTLLNLLGIESVNNGTYNDIDNLQGYPFSVGMHLSFNDTYQTNLETIDYYEPGNGKPVFSESDYGVVAVQNIGDNGQRSVVMSYSLSRLTDLSAKNQFIHNVFNFFNSNITVYPAININSIINEEEAVTINWNHPGISNSSLLGYNILDNGQVIDTIYDRYILSYTDSNPEPGLHHYTVTAGYLDGESEPTQETEAFVFGNEYTNFGYVNDTAEDGILYNPGGIAVVKFSNNESANIDYIRFYIQTADTNPIVLRVYDEVNGEPDSMLSQQVYRKNITEGWHTIDLTSENLEISNNYFIGVIYTVNSSAIGVDTEQSGNTLVKETNTSDWQEYASGNLMITSVLGAPTANGEQHQVVNSKMMLSNYPNPFNPTTNIAFSIPENGLANLSVYDIRGRKVNTLVNNSMTQGEHTVIWNGDDNNGNTLSSGVYFFKLESQGQSKVRKTLLMK